jgi:hypothetical protein
MREEERGWLDWLGEVFRIRPKGIFILEKPF